MLAQKVYPGIGQSWGIMGVAIVSMLVFSPLQLVLQDIIGKEPALLLYYLLSMGAAFAFAHFMRKKEMGTSAYSIPGSTPKVIILVSVGALGLQLGALSPLTSLIPMPDIFKQMFLEIGSMTGVFGFMTLVIAAPIFEELIFRGVILDGLLKRYSPAKSIFISSLLFGIVHLNPWQFITAMGVGSFMGWVYYKTHNLSLCILIHFVNNLFAFITMQFVNLEEELEKSFVESYGGTLNAVLIIMGGTTVFIFCMYLLQRYFSKTVVTEMRE
ncbi:hypothetical protein SAMN06265379_10997 [Saccharicrinis carchari]|uniref:CAAX prenyl protease 2/Lysostaphin resistance protein A-like domain-containing protein n=1 Tax=Saccharicrinis carchari TaxID=1168039 RepID=A0A521EKN1_SACCC|nr:type II CAAX endopeptidase family protein [Saccharicrinis carchari]SMO84467.1 hypothetical protein SAMN06265379_10997 [Saccharicrinis carchari]